MNAVVATSIFDALSKPAMWFSRATARSSQVTASSSELNAERKIFVAGKRVERNAGNLAYGVERTNAVAVNEEHV